jgi:hypothetical protein
MKPELPITDPKFRYTPASRTDVSKTFARIRREQKAAKEAQERTHARILRRVA